ncbi:MAG: hypothetical protein EOP48_00490 [Sphingobacteriales bacterium]|nr:MAG: hypothetical protein EOP48_00490 [Sphingobacteriales bacterium]
MSKNSFNMPQLTNLKLELVLAIESEIYRRGLSQEEAGALAGIARERISEIVNRKIEKMTVDRLYCVLLALNNVAKLNLSI